MAYSRIHGEGWSICVSKSANDKIFIPNGALAGAVFKQQSPSPNTSNQQEDEEQVRGSTLSPAKSSLELHQ
jgi:hypothetical protein